MTEGNFIAFGIEGVPDSQVHLMLDDHGLAPVEVIEAAVAIARLLADEYRREFHAEQPDQGLDAERAVG